MPNPAQIAQSSKPSPIPSPDLSPEEAAAIGLDKGQTPVTPYPATPAPVVTPSVAETLGQSGSDTPVPVGETIEKTGHVKPEVETPPDTTPTPTVEPVPTKTQSVGPIVASNPTVRDMVKSVLQKPGGAETMGAMLTSQPDKDTPKENKSENIDWLGMLKKVVNGGGDFLQRWGLGLQGAPTGQTQGDIQRAQQFEIQKAKTQNELLQRNMLLDNDYQTKRQAIMQTYNVANLTQQAAAERDNRLTELEATYQNEKKLLPQKIAAEMAAYGYGNYQRSGTNPAMTTWGGGK
jgi:hypothetical protein